MTFVLIATGVTWVLVWLVPYCIAAVRVRRNRGRWHWQIKRDRRREMKAALRALRAGWNDKDEAMRIIRGERDES